MKELAQEAEYAAQRIEKHRDRVREKQLLCQKLEIQLQKLNTGLSRLVAEELNKQYIFDCCRCITMQEGVCV
jgi:hypothetical protein